jgi:hypothetical protein
MLLSHQWKSFWRSRNAGSSLALPIVMALLIAYLLSIILAAGLALPHLLHKFYPGRDITPIFFGYILYYFSFDVLMRFTLQGLPVLSTQPYLGQNIPRRKLVAFLNVRSLFHFLNLTPLLLFLPFVFKEIAPAHGAAAAATFITGVVFFTMFNNFLILYIKRRTIISSWWLAGFFTAIAAFIVLDYFHVLSLGTLSSNAFIHLLKAPAFVGIPIVLGLAAWLNNYRFLLHNLYLDEGGRTEKEKTSKEYTWLQHLGISGELIALDIKLILRNKRPKYVLRLCLIFMAYGFIFYTKANLRDPHMYMFLFPSIFMTGIFIINYGQFLFAWHSNFFDGLMSSNISLPLWIRSKFMLYTATSTIFFIITSLYGLISWKLLITQLAAWLYNIGISSVLSIYLATWHYKGINLGKSASFNYQGTSTVQWVYSLVLIILPYLIFYPLARWVDPWIGYAVVGGLGLISLLLQNWWIDVLTRELKRRKYLIMAGFREK